MIHSSVREPAHGGALPGPRTLFRVTALAEMVTWALLILAMVLKYSGTTEALMPVAGGVHGFVFLCYVVVVIAVWIDTRWAAGRGMAALASSILPFLTVPFERSVARRGEPAERWSVLESVEGADPAPRRLLRLVLRRPVVSALLAVAAVAVVFVVLLNAGPPSEWGG